MPSWLALLLQLLPLFLNSPLGAAIAECLATQTGWQNIATCILSKIAAHPQTPGTPEAHAAAALKAAIGNP